MKGVDKMPEYEAKCTRNDGDIDHNNVLLWHIREAHGLFTSQEAAGIAGLRPSGINGYFSGGPLSEQQKERAREVFGYDFVPVEPQQ